jgi:hypothetical protein
MQSWPDGLERVRTTHCRGLFRQIPQPFAWNSALYLSKHGTAIRKFYNYVTGDWSWATEPTEPVEDSESGRMGLNLCGHWTPLETCIALAWRRRHPDSTAPAIRHGPHRKLSASTIRWKAEEDDAEEGPIDGETWFPLETKIGVVSISSGLGYRISSIGRLKNPSGDVTRGFWYRGRRWASVRGAGLCDLDTAAGLQSGIQQPLCIQLAMNALMSGADVEDLATQARIKVSSAWTYLSRAATIAPPEELRHVWEAVVDADLVRALRRMQKRSDPRLGESLTALMSAVTSGRLPPGNTFQDLGENERWCHLRFARMALTRISTSDDKN